MRANFDPSLRRVLQHEGGYVNDPRDPGGATNKGVTQAVYDDWRASTGKPKQSVRSITADEIGAIYRKLYWDKVRGDDLPAGVDYAVFDFAVNSGVNRAARFLQRVVGAAEDGAIGPKTIAAAKAVPAARIIDSISAERLHFLRGLGTFATFGNGWTRRVVEAQQAAKAMA